MRRIVAAETIDTEGFAPALFSAALLAGRSPPFECVSPSNDALFDAAPCSNPRGDER